MKPETCEKWAGWAKFVSVVFGMLLGAVCFERLDNSAWFMGIFPGFLLTAVSWHAGYWLRRALITGVIGPMFNDFNSDIDARFAGYACTGEPIRWWQWAWSLTKQIFWTFAPIGLVAWRLMA